MKIKSIGGLAYPIASFPDLEPGGIVKGQFDFAIMPVSGIAEEVSPGGSIFAVDHADVKVFQSELMLMDGQQHAKDSPGSGGKRMVSTIDVPE